MVPIPLAFPCTLNIDDELIFAFGQEMQPETMTLPDSKLHAFFFNQHTFEWTNVTYSLPCMTSDKYVSNYTCAYLRPLSLVLIDMDDCMPILNVTSMTWTSISSPMEKGHIFNIDENEENVIFIGNDKNESAIYMVSFQLIFCD